MSVCIFHGKDDFIYYLVEWEATWETDLGGCEELVRDFFKKDLGMVSIAGEMAVDELIEIKEVSFNCSTCLLDHLRIHGSELSAYHD